MGLGGLQRSLTSFENFIGSFEECGYSQDRFPETFMSSGLHISSVSHLYSG